MQSEQKQCPHTFNVRSLKFLLHNWHLVMANNAWLISSSCALAAGLFVRYFISKDSKDFTLEERPLASASNAETDFCCSLKVSCLLFSLACSSWLICSAYFCNLELASCRVCLKASSSCLNSIVRIELCFCKVATSSLDVASASTSPLTPSSKFFKRSSKSSFILRYSSVSSLLPFSAFKTDI
ncbi:hypothetical protein OGAPHI_000639 [Ogataea philodendri]|uniref:Uncharacterized protein n=1 Tax=Ogataea philodendri TaxID=1378263 RepID=A0A9P8PES7_9ASCO|nr:uncharacterized protein OGAPHI_000639 [Ogataea philodendri]KAH3670928.1 hypothetical protein OGAPHI_000639 [Ogataea philodendri]